MIYFKDIRWKNLLSTGNQFTEVQLNKSSTTLIVGDNGSGKSTVLDALCFGLFNKPFRRITKPQLVNSINDGGLLVEIELSNDDLLVLTLAAHDRDITLNQLCNSVLRSSLKDLDYRFEHQSKPQVLKEY